MDRFVPTSCSILPKPRQRPRPDSEIYGGQVADTLQQWCAMYFAKRWDRPPFAPELPSKNWDFGPLTCPVQARESSSCALSVWETVISSSFYSSSYSSWAFFCFPFCSYERPLLRLEMRCN